MEPTRSYTRARARAYTHHFCLVNYDYATSQWNTVARPRRPPPQFLSPTRNQRPKSFERANLLKMGRKIFFEAEQRVDSFEVLEFMKEEKFTLPPSLSLSQRFNSPIKQRYSAWRLKPVERGARTSPVPPGTKRRRRGRGGSTTSIPRNRPEVVGARSCGSNISTGLARNPPAISQEVADKPPPRLSLFDQLSNHELAARIPGIKDPSLSS